mgnify:CR=1 FL=1
MIAELGHLLAFLALGAAVGQSILGLTSGGEPARRLAVASAMFAGLALLALIMSFVRLDFSVELVAEHSHSQKPLLYRIAGAWGNHEGSMLLWCVIMAGYGAVAITALACALVFWRGWSVLRTLGACALAGLLVGLAQVLV